MTVSVSLGALAQLAQQRDQFRLGWHLIAAAWATQQMTIGYERAPGTGTLRLIGLKFVTAETAFHESHESTPSVASSQFNAPPTMKAKGKIKAVMASAVFQPRSFSVTENWAMQGTKSVMVVVATSSC